jgi:site-specific DNA-cytosine methylase
MFVLENVMGVKLPRKNAADKNATSMLDLIMKNLTEIEGYSCHYVELPSCCPLPASRPRIYFVGARVGSALAATQRTAALFEEIQSEGIVPVDKFLHANASDHCRCWASIHGRTPGCFNLEKNAGDLHDSQIMAEYSKHLAKALKARRFA